MARRNGWLVALAYTSASAGGLLLDGDGGNEIGVSVWFGSDDNVRSVIFFGDGHGLQNNMVWCGSIGDDSLITILLVSCCLLPRLCSWRGGWRMSERICENEVAMRSVKKMAGKVGQNGGKAKTNRTKS
jgi:hypothetical protein